MIEIFRTNTRLASIFVMNFDREVFCGFIRSTTFEFPKLYARKWTKRTTESQDTFFNGNIPSLIGCDHFVHIKLSVGDICGTVCIARQSTMFVSTWTPQTHKTDQNDYQNIVDVHCRSAINYPAKVELIKTKHTQKSTNSKTGFWYVLSSIFFNFSNETHTHNVATHPIRECVVYKIRASFELHEQTERNGELHRLYIYLKLVVKSSRSDSKEEEKNEKILRIF